MTDITLILVGIILLFAVFITLRSVFSMKVCALCGAVSLTWITLLILFYLGHTIDPMFIGILIGGSVVGSMYLLEQKLPEKYQLFKLSYFLTLVSVAYFLLAKTVIIEVLGIILIVWLFMILIYVGGRVEKLKTMRRKIIECCKNW